jgi:hypothetical protein
VLGQVAVALHVGEHPQDRHHLLALVRRGLAVHELQLDRIGDVPDDLVDDVVPLHEHLGRLAVPGQQGMGGAGDTLADQGEDLGEQPVHLMGDGNGRPQRLLHHQGPDNGGGGVGVVGALEAAHIAANPKRHPRYVTGRALVDSERGIGPWQGPAIHPDVTVASWSSE